MKKIKTLLWAICAIVALASCSGVDKNGYQDAESFGKLKQELTDKFGKDAYYTKFAVMNEDYGSTISVTVTKNPASLKMEDWITVNGGWQQNAEVTLEIEGDAKPEEFMFQLDKIMNIDLLGKLIEQSKQKVIAEKKIEEVTVKTITMSVPDDGDFSTSKYFITIEPKQGGTTFNFWYNLDGSLHKFDY
jgi:hypothetical protein